MRTLSMRCLFAAAALLGGMTATADLCAGDAPLLWKTHMECWKELPLFAMNPRDTKNVELVREQGRSFLRVKGRRGGLFAPSGSHAGDIIFKFYFRPDEDEFALQLSINKTDGGSGRYSTDMLQFLRLTISESGVDFFPAIHRIAPKRRITNQFFPPPLKNPPDSTKLQPKKTPFPAGFRWGRTWRLLTMITNGRDVIIRIDNKEVARYRTNLTMGSVVIGNESGTNDYADFELRETRPAFEPYRKENMIDWRGYND